MYPFLDTMLLWTVRALAGDTTAQRIGAAAEWLYPAADPGTARYRRSKMLLRSLTHLGPTMRVLNCLWDSKPLLALLQRHPYLAEKVHRPYSYKSLNANARAGNLISHYEFVLRQPGAQLLLSAMQADAVLAEFTGKSGASYRLLLSSARDLPKEGELMLRLECQGFTLLKTAFTCGSRNGVPGLVIGCWQGNNCPTSRDRMRDATRDLWGMRPRDLLFTGLQALAAACGLQGMAGIGNTQHIYRHWRKRRAIVQSYDAIWTDMGGTEGPDGLFSLPLEHQRRPLNAYPSNKRGAAARRHALEDQVLAQLIAAFAASQAEHEQTRPTPAVMDENSIMRSGWKTVAHS
ncbi:MAG TPA: DUF535 family protein [Noviherbaspirillum sp.]